MVVGTVNTVKKNVVVCYGGYSTTIASTNIGKKKTETKKKKEKFL